MTAGTKDNEDKPSTMISKGDKPKPKVVGKEEAIAAAHRDFDMAWVRHRTGQNRGEERFHHGPRASFDAILDRRLALAPAAPLDTSY